MASRAPDLIFVEQKLAEGHLHRTIGDVLLRALSIATGNSNNYYLYQNIWKTQNVFPKQRNVSSKPLSQTEQLMLINMVRHTASQTISAYEDYRKAFFEREAPSDLNQLYLPIDAEKEGLSQHNEFYYAYSLVKCDLKAPSQEFEFSRKRQALVNLAGETAVLHLDQELESELHQS